MGKARPYTNLTRILRQLIILRIMPSRIVGTGIALPKRIISNAELSRRLGLSEAEIERKTGIQTRHWVGEGETASTLAAEAARSALRSAHIPVEAIDLIIVSTTSPDMFFPSTACLVQKSLSTRPIPAFDINASCTGFLYALSVGDQYLRNRSAGHVLIVATEVKSPFIDLNDPSTAVLFGDGAGAVVLSQGDRGIRSIRIFAEGSRHRLIHLPVGGSRRPATIDSLHQGLQYMKMEGKGLFRMAVKKMELALAALSDEYALSSTDIDLFIFHQANLRILEVLLERRKIPLRKTEITIPKFGNTSSSSLPIALDTALRKGRLQKGDRLVLCAFGGGVTWGTALLDW
ncbi:MAG: 3-oxoacyl-ACP synthase III family protein [Nitrospiria bacterium]